jgi:hypothetical protein
MKVVREGVYMYMAIQEMMETVGKDKPSTRGIK